jgi:hypothetical protein
MAHKNVILIQKINNTNFVMTRMTKWLNGGLKKLWSGQHKWPLCSFQVYKRAVICTSVCHFFIMQKVHEDILVFLFTQQILCLFIRYGIQWSLLIGYRFHVYDWMHMEECSLGLSSCNGLFPLFWIVIYLWLLIQAFSLDCIFIIECMWRNVADLGQLTN